MLLKYTHNTVSCIESQLKKGAAYYMQIESQCLSVPRLLLPSYAAPCPAHPATRASGAHVLVEAERATKGPKDLAAKQLQGGA